MVIRSKINIPLTSSCTVAESVEKPGSDPQEPLCPRCGGSGEIRVMTQEHGPNDYEIDVECPCCHGVGTLPPDGGRCAQ